MADFGQTELEVKNEVNPEDNKIVIADGVDPNLTATVNSNGELKVVVTGGGSAGQLVETGDVSGAGDVGRIIVGFDGTNYRFISVDTNGRLQIDVNSLPDITLASQASPFTTDVNVNINQPLPAGTNNIGDVDVVSSVLPTGAATEAKQDTIIANQLPDGHNVTVDNAGGVNAVNVQDGGNSLTIDNTAIDTNLDVLLSTRATESTLQSVQTAVEIIDDWDESDRAKVNPVVGQAGVAAGSGIDTANTQRVSLATDVPLPTGGNVIGEMRLVDANDTDLARLDGSAIIPGTVYGVPIMGVDLNDNVHIITVTEDLVDGKNRLSIEGKVSVSAPVPPPTATAVTIAADTPLNVSGTSTTEYIIPNGVTFSLGQLTFGAEGDPNEKGSKATISYVDAGGTEHVIERLYFTGFTAQIFPDTNTARDGTLMVGNGTTTLIRIVRERLGGAALEIDCVARGYYE